MLAGVARRSRNLDPALQLARQHPGAARISSIQLAERGLQRTARCDGLRDPPRALSFGNAEAVGVMP